MVIRRKSQARAGGLPRALLAAVCLVGSLRCMGQSRPSAEYGVKAAFLYEFGRFVEWGPVSERGEFFVICVLGEDPFGILLDEAVKGKTASGHSVIAKRVVGVRDSSGCHILFISPSENSRLLEILKVLEGKGILTVGEGSQFTRRGGMISFRTEQNRVRFGINTAAMERTGLKASSQLLKLARIEETGKGGS